MKKLFTIMAALSLPLIITAQTIRPNKQQSYPAYIQKFNGSEQLPPLIQKTGLNRSAGVEKGRVIGVTFYDLQTNNSIAKRLKTFPNGDVIACWTFSDFFAATDPSTAPYDDRGTGYNHHSSTTSEWLDFPVKRIEATRTGWPNIVSNADGEEIIIAHAITPSSQTRAVSTHLAKKALSATTWKNTINGVAGNNGNGIWPRVANLGDTIIVIDSAEDTATIDNDESGFQSPVFISRSVDGGQNWMTAHKSSSVLPGWNTSNYSNGPGGDNYDIDARNNTVSIVLGGLENGITLWKSDDRGMTFTRTVIEAFPIPKYASGKTDTNADGIADTLSTNDGAVSVVIDYSGTTHIFWGTLKVLNSNSSADSLGIIFQNSINYWNDKDKTIIPQVGFAPSEADNTIPGGEELKGSNYALARYGLGGMAIQPSAGIDKDNNIYMCYAAITPGDTSIEGITSLNNSGCSYRNLFIVKSTDAGKSFSTPINITNTTITENVFASMNREVNKCINILYMRDPEPGVALQRTPALNHPSVENEIVYLSLKKTTFEEETDCFEVGIQNILTNVTIEAFPNPAQNEVLFNISTMQPSAFDLTITNVIGQILITKHIEEGTDKFNLNINELENGIYFYTLKSGNQSLSKKLIVNKL